MVHGNYQILWLKLNLSSSGPHEMYNNNIQEHEKLNNITQLNELEDIYIIMKGNSPSVICSSCVLLFSSLNSSWPVASATLRNTWKTITEGCVR